MILWQRMQKTLKVNLPLESRLLLVEGSAAAGDDGGGGGSITARGKDSAISTTSSLAGPSSL